jgi:hypothetical protein
LIPAITMFAPRPRRRVDAADAILFGVLVLTTRPSSAESLELEVIRGERKQ